MQKTNIIVSLQIALHCTKMEVCKFLSKKERIQLVKKAFSHLHKFPILVPFLKDQIKVLNWIKGSILLPEWK